LTRPAQGAAADQITRAHFKNRAPGKELIWFENSAHMINSEERDAFNKILVEKVLPIAASRNVSFAAPRSVG
jgi:pimeloyl-ACP methyl ester carboxylesterase